MSTVTLYEFKCSRKEAFEFQSGLFVKSAQPFMASLFSCVVGNSFNRLNVLAYDTAYVGSLRKLYWDFLKRALSVPSEAMIGVLGRVAMKSGLLWVNAELISKDLKKSDPFQASALAFFYSVPWTVFWRFLYNAKVAQQSRPYAQSLNLLITPSGVRQYFLNFISFAPLEFARVQVWLGLYLYLSQYDSFFIEEGSVYLKAADKTVVISTTVSVAETCVAFFGDYLDVTGSVRGQASSVLSPRAYVEDVVSTFKSMPSSHFMRSFSSLLIKNLFCNSAAFSVLILSEVWLNQQVEESLNEFQAPKLMR